MLREQPAILTEPDAVAKMINTLQDIFGIRENPFTSINISHNFLSKEPTAISIVLFKRDLGFETKLSSFCGIFSTVKIEETWKILGWVITSPVAKDRCN